MQIPPQGWSLYTKNYLHLGLWTSLRVLHSKPHSNPQTYSQSQCDVATSSSLRNTRVVNRNIYIYIIFSKKELSKRKLKQHNKLKPRLTKASKSNPRKKPKVDQHYPQLHVCGKSVLKFNPLKAREKTPSSSHSSRLMSNLAGLQRRKKPVRTHAHTLRRNALSHPKLCKRNNAAQSKPIALQANATFFISCASDPGIKVAKMGNAFTLF